MIRTFLSRLKQIFRHELGKPVTQPCKFPTVIYPDDTFLVSYPRSGNAWLRRLIASMKYPEVDLIAENINNYVPDIYVVGARLADYERPRIMKSHELYEPSYPRVIYLVRDGRDVAVSYYNYYQTIRGYKGSFDEFLELFLSGDVSFGSWQDHVRSWVFREHSIPFICVQYEQLHREPIGMLQKVADFLGLVVDDAQIEMAVKNSTFEKQKKYLEKQYPSLYKQGYHGGVRGSPRAWKETFDEELLGLFWNQAGEVMERLGYRQDET